MTDEASTEIPADAESVAAGAGIASDPPLGEPEAPKSAREIMDAELSKIEAAKDEEPKPKAEPVKAKEEPAPVEKPAVVAKSDGVKPAAVPGEQVAKPLSSPMVGIGSMQTQGNLCWTSLRHLVAFRIWLTLCSSIMLCLPAPQWKHWV